MHMFSIRLSDSAWILQFNGQMETATPSNCDLSDVDRPQAETSGTVLANVGKYQVYSTLSSFLEAWQCVDGKIPSFRWDKNQEWHCSVKLYMFSDNLCVMKMIQ